MRRFYQGALAAGLAALGAIGWLVVSPSTAFPGALVVGSAAVPLAVLFAVAGRTDTAPPWAALLGGATIGVLVALIGHAVVFGFAYAFLLGFAEAGTAVLDTLRIDPRLSDVLGSRWMMLLLIELVVVAPLVEEIGKAIGAGFARPQDRRHAFMAGAAAGVGFAIVENGLFATGAYWAGYGWDAILIGRMLGAAVHPLATGLVFLAWWEYRRGSGAPARNVALGVGVHAVWNGAQVALLVAATAYEVAPASAAATAAALAYTAGFGAIAAGALWMMTCNVAAGVDGIPRLDTTDGRLLAGWTVLAGSIAVPAAVLVAAFPEFVAGG